MPLKLSEIATITPDLIYVVKIKPFLSPPSTLNFKLGAFSSGFKTESVFYNYEEAATKGKDVGYVIPKEDILNAISSYPEYTPYRYMFNLAKSDAEYTLIFGKLWLDLARHTTYADSPLEHLAGSILGALTNPTILIPICFIAFFPVLLRLRSLLLFLILSAFASALISEALLFEMQAVRGWDGFFAQFIAGLLQAIIVYGIFVWMKVNKQKKTNDSH